MKDIQIKHTSCFWCHDHCNVAVHVKDGEIIKVLENKALPHSKGLKPTVRACPRSRAAAEWMSHPDRLNHPLKRIGQKGSGKWEQISWEQALDEIAQKLARIKKEIGPEAVATQGGTSRTHDEYKIRFFNLFGSPNQMTQGHICWGTNNLLISALSGYVNTNPPKALPGITKCMMHVGDNSQQAGRGLWRLIRETKRQGAKYIVIDPRRTASAELADIWLQPRPGTDCALLMAMINIIITKDLYDKEFVANWCHGFDELAKRATEYPLERVAEITGVPADKIKEAAIVYATTKPAQMCNNMGIEHQSNMMGAMQARHILPAITGNFDVYGGDYANRPTQGYISEEETAMGDNLSADQKAKQLGADRFRFVSWEGFDQIAAHGKQTWGRFMSPAHMTHAHAPTVFRAMLTGEPYPVRAFFSLASNPLVANPNTKLVYKALKSLELYVVMDFWMTPSAAVADYVLPSASWLERPCLRSGLDTQSFIAGGEAPLPHIVPGKFERLRDYDLWRELGIRLGQKDHWPCKTLEDDYDRRLAPLGLTLKSFTEKHNGFYPFKSEFRKFETSGFPTPTGKFELSSTIMAKMGYDPLPKYREPHESPVSTPELAEKYPFVLTTGGRFLPMYHSEHRQIDSLRKQHPDPIVQIHPDTAVDFAIADGDWVWIETERGRIRQKCRLFDGIAKDVIHAEHAWWFPELPNEEPWLHGVWESNINVITTDDPDQCNEISGGWPLRGLLCNITKAKQY